MRASAISFIGICGPQAQGSDGYEEMARAGQLGRDGALIPLQLI